MPILLPKTRKVIEAAVRRGVPPIAAGASLGISAKSMQCWMAVGLRTLDEPPVKPHDPTSKVEVGKGDWYMAGDWYKHELECKALALAVVESEGKLVGALIKRMWKNSTKNADMMKFLFKAYTHTHGIREPAQPKASDVEEDDGALGSEDNVQIVLPDNGRLMVPT